MPGSVAASLHPPVDTAAPLHFLLTESEREADQKATVHSPTLIPHAVPLKSSPLARNVGRSPGAFCNSRCV